MIISIADLHGRVDLLRAMLAYFPPDTHYVCLGDVIDRGPNSLDCVDLMLELYDAGRATLLRGNHEQMALEALEKFEQYKGADTLDRYKASLVAYGRWMDAGGETVTEERQGFSLESMPEALCRYLKLTTIVQFVSVLGLTDTPPRVSSVLCSHAAPPHPREGMSQTATALWLRPQDGPFPLPEFVVASVHGHTPIRKPARVGQHIYTDLGAVQTGQLCTVRLDNLVGLENPEITVFQLGRSRMSPFAALRSMQFAQVGQALPFQTQFVNVEKT